MIADIRTIMWKEWKGLFRPGGSRLKGAFILAVPAFITVLLPLQIGEGFMRTPFVLLLSYIVPLTTVGIAVPDSFAGERERHTLETLLASRLSDRAILFAKIAVPVVFAWVVLASAHTLALAIFNIAHWNGGLQVYTPTILLGIVGFGLLLPLIAAGAGVLISLRAATVQGAGQFLMIVLLIPIFVVQVLGVVFAGIGRGGDSGVIEVLETTNWTLVLLLVLAGLLVTALVLLATVTARFQRARLILN